MLDLLDSARFGKGHIQSDAGHDRLPGLIFGEPQSFVRTPEIDDLFFRNAFEEVLVGFVLRPGYRSMSHCDEPWAVFYLIGALATRLRTEQAQCQPPTRERSLTQGFLNHRKE